MNHGRVGETPIREAVGDDAYLDGEFVSVVQKRGAAIIAARKLSSALSAASSVCDHARTGSTAPRPARGSPWVSSARAATRRTASRPG